MPVCPMVMVMGALANLCDVAEVGVSEVVWEGVGCDVLRELVGMG